MSTRSRSLKKLLAVVASGGLAAVSCAQPVEPPQASDDIFYQIMPIAFRDGGKGAMADDPHRYGDFAGILDSLDYIQSIGVSAIWLTPIFPSPAYHGYQHMPADSLNPWFGTQDAWVTLVKAVHGRQMKIYIDLVAYGINRESEYYKDAHNNPASKYTSWLAFKDDKNDQSQGYAFKTWNGAPVGFTHWNLNTPGPRELVTSWSK
jgi:trehalose-6-phosphate hydrolase